MLDDALVNRLLPEWVALRRDLHAHPELAFQERRTSEVVAQRLAGAGIDVHRGIGGTGVVGVLRRGNSADAIALRADMDALPLAEENDFAHRSRHAGRMHACGHDGHTAMLLAAADYLAAGGHFDGTVVFVFQPAEEGDGGAPAMIADGLFEQFPVRAIYGLHNWPGLPAGHLAVHPGSAMASSDTFDIELEGRGAHAAMPHQGADPVVAAAQLVTALQTLVSRETDPLDSAVLSLTRLRAGGEAYNIIPGSVTLGGTVRAFTPTVRDRLQAGVTRVADGIASAHGMRARTQYRRGYPPTVNDAEHARRCERAARTALGDAQVRMDLRPSMGAEDFAYFLEAKPGCYVWLGNGEGAEGGRLHHPRYDFNDAVLPTGVAFWVGLVKQELCAEPASGGG